MSRHRYVRNIDLDAQMITAMPIARALLKDVRPPISDDAIADSLWHYWFDVDKAVTWLRKDWEKKGASASPPDHILPTPAQSPRPRPAKRPRLHAVQTERESSPQPPLSALQRLSIARKEAGAGRSPSPAVASTAPSAGDRTSSPTPRTGVASATEGTKPTSKLALLAQKRKEAAQTASTTAASSASSSAPPSRVVTPAPPGASPAAGSSSAASPAKPLSKLAQKMAAARAAKAEAVTQAAAGQDQYRGGVGAASNADSTPTNNVPPEAMDVDPTTSLFIGTPEQAPDRAVPDPAHRPSPFFSLLTSTSASPKSSPPVEPDSGQILHLPFVRDQAGLERRVREAFGAADSPDDIVLRARQAAKTSGGSTPKSASLPGKPRVQTAAAGTSKSTVSQPSTPAKKQSVKVSASSSGGSTPKVAPSLTGAQADLAGLHLDEEVDEAEREKERERYREKPGLNMRQEELVAKVKKDEEESGKKSISLIVVGHVDAGKSTLMGRLLYDLGELSEKEKTANERGSKKVGKGSFAFAWGLDALGDERDRGVTIDIATTHFNTPHRNVTLLDAPGHRDFIPAMISGAAQADVALMVVDGSPGEFEAGFERGGQTREHAWLVRSLGVREIVVGINKLDLVSWSQDRYDEIVDALRPFLVSAGFTASKTTFLPLGAMEGVNVLVNEEALLKEWYDGPTLIDTLDQVEVPERPFESPLRIPVSNVFKGQTAVASGVAVSGRLCSGVLQVGDRIRAVPGDEVAQVRTIEVDEDSAPYAVAGQNVTLYLSGIDPIHLAIGTVLCPTSLPVPLVTQFTAQILVFDLQSPIIAGTPVELFHHSMNLPATISKLLAISERGQVVKKNPRVLQKGATATVEITLRPTQGSSRTPSIPLETAAENKEMGRVLIRRGGETIAAGVVMEIIS
ncbi:Elongation factor 1 alpha-like protein [Saitozyma sp. JCM 24511]|nr:Elongation factor 1 alpha-like protein [Saitozyma sp. JCM 24511]